MSTNKDINLDAPLTILASRNKPTKTMEGLMSAGIHTIEDLIWIFPLHLDEIPEINSFDTIEEDKIFLGKGRIIQSKMYPAFGRKGKGRVQLFNIDLMVKDSFSESIIRMRWFNSYPNVRKQLKELEEFVFLGTPKLNDDIFQMANPKINPIIKDKFLITYPTINSVTGNHTKKLIEKIPLPTWHQLDQKTSSITNHEIALSEAFLTLHGLNRTIPAEKAKERIKYEEFAKNQIKVWARRSRNMALKAKKFEFDQLDLDKVLNLFPYQFTNDQHKVLEQILKDIKQGYPMMRLVQGDVGCGKTSLAIALAYLMGKQGEQIALMCPTESLAIQHFKNFTEILNDEVNLSLLLGSTSAKDKKLIYQQLKEGEIKIIIGTHSLFQDSVGFKSLSLAIIDEQHKFGVEQRLKLYQKGLGVHSLIMTATPIPRSLQLSHYGDLSISTIKELPKGRKGIKTRMVPPENLQKYLSFIKTRLSMQEQVYIVVPAISENENFPLANINEIEEFYRKVFPEFSIETIHGQIKPEEREKTLERFSQKKIDILIATTVIEVGIDNPNATVMSLYNPERFGLSSIHQLRGRVGRGEKPGFCFLILKDNVSKESMERLEVIEKTNDGFEIAEADLKLRGQGDLFGTNQSGSNTSFQLANLVLDSHIFEQVSRDLDQMKEKSPEKLNQLLTIEVNKISVSTTI